MTRRHLRRWRVGLVGTVALTGLGLIYASPTLLAATVIPLAFVLYGTVSSVPPTIDVTVTRQFDPPGPNPGETVDVTLTVTNSSEHAVPDVRIVDGVPGELAVDDGSPRAAAPLSPDEELTIEYTLIAKRGEFQFDAPVVRYRSLSASHRETTKIAPRGDDTLTCANSVREAPIDNAALPRAGTLPTDSGGSGLEFYATRQYRAGDPMNRIDWRHYAKTDEFVTIQYREEQAARTVIVIDARPIGRVTPAAGYPTGTSLCSYAGERMYDALDRAGVVTSVTAVGIEPGSLGGLVGPDGLPWVDPDKKGANGLRPSVIFNGVHQVSNSSVVPVSTAPPTVFDQGSTPSDESGNTTESVRADGAGTHRGATASRDAGGTGTGTGGETDGRAATPGQYDDRILDAESSHSESAYIDHLLARLPPNAQVLICSPVLDNWPVSLAQALQTRGYPFLVLSPDVLRQGSAGQRIAGVHRTLRLRALDRMGQTVSWQPEQPIEYALRRSIPHLLDQR